MKRSCINLNKQDKKAQIYQVVKKRNKVQQAQLPQYWPKKYVFLLDQVRQKRLRNISFLCLSNCNLHNVNFLKFFDHTLLKTLNLNNNRLLTLKGLQKCNFAQLQILYVRYNYFSECQPFHLYSIPKIKQIYLNQNKIACIQIPKLKKSCKSLKKVQVHGNPIIKINDQLHIIQN